MHERRTAATTVGLILAGTALALATTLALRSLAPGVSRDARLVLSYVVVVLPLAIAVRDPARFGFTREHLGIAVTSGAILATVKLGFGRPTVFATEPAGTLGGLAAVGVIEEAMFRGVLQSQLVGWLGRWRGLLATAALFSLFHIPLLLAGTAIDAAMASLGLIFAVGIVLGLYMLAVRNVAGPAILHAAINWLG